MRHPGNQEVTSMSVHSFEEADSLQLFEELRLLERAATIRAQGYWFVLAVIGAITMFSPTVPAARLASYWLVAGPAGVVLVFWWYRRREALVVHTWWWYAITPLWMIVGTGVAAEVFPGQRNFSAAYAVVGVGFMTLAVLERSYILAGVAAATPVLAVLITSIGTVQPPALPATAGFMWFFVGGVVWAFRE
jgi:hypothetical protein